MNSSCLRPLRRLGLAALALAVALTACSDRLPTLAPGDALHNKGGGKGGGGGGGGGTVSVTAAEPAYGERGELRKLVRIYGSGFDQGSVATWERNGAPDPKITTHATRFISTTELEAEISIAGDADLALYDIGVMTSGGKKGIGLEMFEVLTRDPHATFYIPAVQGTLGLWSDGIYLADDPFAGASSYAEGVCGVATRIFASSAASQSGDAFMDPGLPNYRDRRCKHYPRKVRLDFRFPDPGSGAPAGPIETIQARINVLALQRPGGSIPIGAVEERGLNLALTGSKYCDGLRFRPILPEYGDLVTGADHVRVMRVDSRTWHVYTAAGAARAACLKNGAIVGRYLIPVKFHIVADQDLW